MCSAPLDKHWIGFGVSVHLHTLQGGDMQWGRGLAWKGGAFAVGKRMRAESSRSVEMGT